MRLMTGAATSSKSLSRLIGVFEPRRTLSARITTVSTPAGSITVLRFTARSAAQQGIPPAITDSAVSTEFSAQL
jgi:hypothetical protein